MQQIWKLELDQIGTESIAASALHTEIGETLAHIGHAEIAAVHFRDAVVPFLRVADQNKTLALAAAAAAPPREGISATSEKRKPDERTALRRELRSSIRGQASRVLWPRGVRRGCRVQGATMRESGKRGWSEAAS